MARSDPKNLSRYWWDRHTPGLSLMCADFTTQQYAPHTHDGFVIAVTETGGAVIKSRGVVEEARASKLFVFNPVEAHSGWMGCSERWRYRSFYLTQSAIHAVARGLGIEDVPYFTSNMFGDADLVEGFLTLHRALQDGHDLFRERELLFSTFGRLYQRHGSGGGRIDPPPRDEALLAIVTDLINDRHAEDLHLEDLSAAVGLTPFQLIGLFKRCLGLTPHTYLTQARLRRACHFLRRGMPIAHVAAATGFYDQSALTRQFKRCYGITPLQFAKAAAGAAAH
ncbi:AraC-type DNA-binding protein [Paraburkholderia susongensis]|uniref:AraC-type DNA-binding protein n=2 Tax=Paraburkholderia susongensis TaxID=1515439 RepID=A0A1X7LP03_9BURK|nr:AraC-type DNA-binding protein [Paraburkholderia susongensis]